VAFESAYREIGDTVIHDDLIINGHAEELKRAVLQCRVHEQRIFCTPQKEEKLEGLDWRQLCRILAPCIDPPAFYEKPSWTGGSCAASSPPA